MQHDADIAGIAEITPEAAIDAARYGERAKCLQRLIRMDLPVPRTVALSFDTVHAIASERPPDIGAILAAFGPEALVSVRPSSEYPEWGGPGTFLNIGMNDRRHAALAASHGKAAADTLYLRFVQSYAVHVARLDPEGFDGKTPADTLCKALAAYEAEADEPFPQDPAFQLGQVLRVMARAWEGTTARLLREARGAPADAGLGLVVQEMALGVGPGESGAGVIQFVDSATGQPQVTGRYLGQSQGREALAGGEGVLYLTRDARGRSLEEHRPAAFADLVRYGAVCRERLREEMAIEFTIADGRLSVLDAVRAPRSARAALRIAVALAADGVISREEALLRIEPAELAELMHSQVDPDGPRDRLASGIAASPGAAAGRIVFSSAAAQASAARGEACVLVRRETTPEDIRGLHAAVAVLTERGGMSSHAAVLARGLGLPCVVGLSQMQLDRRAGTLTAADGRVFGEGDVVTVDGVAGEALAGAAKMVQPALDETFRTFLAWATAAGDIAVRANADTPAEAERARAFGAEGIGLCRTEHMFFESDRLTVMHEMIFADRAEDRRAAIDRLLPMQRADFARLFEIMAGQPVCIRLFDPPLHEFLPRGRDGVCELAAALDLSIARVTERIEALSEFNPMLGMRGVRLGITVPEIYEMQVRAIFEATVAAGRSGEAVVPEIMIPLVSARREVEIVRARIDAVAAAVTAETGARFDYRLGVMVETPRAALRAGEIAEHTHFLSFGTNDLTQMTYGLSRDDAGRFMGEYVRQGVVPEDPFHSLDVEGVGELLSIAAERGRATSSDIVLSICGEHGGNAESIEFCRQAGFDYVSCSPFRVAVARLAAARLAVAGRRKPAPRPGR